MRIKINRPPLLAAALTVLVVALVAPAAACATRDKNQAPTFEQGVQTRAASPTVSSSPTPSPSATAAAPLPTVTLPARVAATRAHPPVTHRPSARPTTARPTVRPTKTTPPAPRPTTPKPKPATYYASCAAAKAAGAAPLHRGEPGYRKGLDRDGDGVACE